MRAFLQAIWNSVDKDRLLVWFLVSPYAFLPFIALYVVHRWTEDKGDVMTYLFGDGQLYVMGAVLVATGVSELAASVTEYRRLRAVLTTLGILMIVVLAVSYVCLILLGANRPRGEILDESAPLLLIAYAVGFCCVFTASLTSYGETEQ